MNVLLLALLSNSALASEFTRPDREGTFWLPPSASTFASEVDFVWDYIYWVSLVAFIIIAGAMVYLAVRYRERSADDRTLDLARHAPRRPAAWPADRDVLVRLQGMDELRCPARGCLRGQGHGPEVVLDLHLHDARRDADRERHGRVRRQAGEAAHVSKDVLHSFYIPTSASRRMCPTVHGPGFEATWEGEHNVFCTEFCGDSHSRMIGGQGPPADFRALRDHDGRAITDNHLVRLLLRGLPQHRRVQLVGRPRARVGTYDGSPWTWMRTTCGRASSPRRQVVAAYFVMPHAGQLTDEQIDGLIATGP